MFRFNHHRENASFTFGSNLLFRLHLVLYNCPFNCHLTWVRGQWTRPAHPRCLAHSTAATLSAPTPPSRPGQTPVSFEALLATQNRRRLRCHPVRSWWKAGSWTGCSWAHCLPGTGSGVVGRLLWCRTHWNNAVINKLLYTCIKFAVEQ